MPKGGRAVHLTLAKIIGLLLDEWADLAFLAHYSCPRHASSLERDLDAEALVGMHVCVLCSVTN